MKIALCTLYGNANLGNKLQNYALLKLAEESDNDVSTIVTHLTNRNLKFRIKSEVAIVLYSFGIRRAKKRAISWRREKRLENFSKKYLNITKRVKFDDCGVLSSKYDYFITGSDQVWHKWPCSESTKDPDAQLKYFYLMFTPPKKRISFAPSFGFEDFPEEDKEIHRKGLQEIEYLSCREESAFKLIKKIACRDAVILPDPTLCLSADEWSIIEKKPNMYNLPERYVLIYFLGNISNESQQVLDNIAAHCNARIVNIYDVHHEDGIHNEQYYITDPNEFIYLVHHASFVLTDSFHACVFSIIYHKRFIVFKREEKHMEKMFSRIDNLLSITGVSNCVYEGQNADELFSMEIDYRDVDDNINILAEKARTYLENALDSNN